jgi:hypothetical protein
MRRSETTKEDPMVGRAQQIDDPGTKHDRDNLVRMEDRAVTRNIFFVVLGIAAFIVLLYFLGGSNAMH